jgi:hypothetical protein
MYRFHIVADGGDGKARSVKGFRRIAGRRGAPITKELGGNQEPMVLQVHADSGLR